jgi:EAL domain-containing protein (putative c-di-GMP-specific phosphodiesterase class I)
MGRFGRAYDAPVEVLFERLELGALSRRRGTRGLAVLAVRVHRPGQPDAPLPDTAGYLEQEVLHRIHRCLRPVDTVAVVDRMRFAVLLERAEEGPFAVHVADQLVSDVRCELNIAGRPLDLVASVGVAVHPDDGDTADELMRAADAAAEAARLGGGDFFGFSTGPMNEVAARRIAIERALVEAQSRGELRLSYQPQIDTRDGTIVGVESLLRWHTATLGDVPPAEFVPILEATGAIEDVGAWVLRSACAQVAEWGRAGQLLRVGVNVSAQQLGADSFVDVVLDALQQTGIQPALLELELTESVLVDNPAKTRRMLEALRQHGVRVAVDDFGTGYASLAYIRQFPMDTLKIDRQFVRGLPIDEESAAITSAIVALGRSLRLEIVAEGVETEAEEEFLHSQQCFVVQGFRHARPMPAEDFSAWRERRPWG